MATEPRPDRDSTGSRPTTNEPGAPRLGLAQRLLLVLPNLEQARHQRKETIAARSRDATARSASKDRTADSATRQASANGRTTTTGNRSTSRTPTPDAKRPFKDVPTPELAERIRTLDETERRNALLAVPLGVALGILLLFLVDLREPSVIHAIVNHKHVTEHQDTTLTIILGALGPVFALGIFPAAYYRKRSLTIVALLFTGYSLGLYGLLPFGGLAIWLVLRSSKVQRELTERGAHPRQVRARERAEARAGRKGGGTTGSATGRRPATKSSSTAKRRAKDEPAGPGASKRYTPPKDPRSKPPAATV